MLEALKWLTIGFLAIAVGGLLVKSFLQPRHDVTKAVHLRRHRRHRARAAHSDEQDGGAGPAEPENTGE